MPARPWRESDNRCRDRHQLELDRKHTFGEIQPDETDVSEIHGGPLLRAEQVSDSAATEDAVAEGHCAGSVRSVRRARLRTSSSPT